MAHIKKMVIQGFKSFAKRTEIPFDTGINVIIGPNGSGKCLTEESLVQIADGELVEIGKLVNSKLKNAVKTEDGYIAAGDGVEVMCLDMESLKVTKKPIKAFVKRASPKKILRIKTRSGREIKSTKYHPFFILKEGKVVSAKAEELKKGIRIAVPRKIDLTAENKYFVELIDMIKEEENIYVPFEEEFLNILNSVKGELTWNELAGKIGISYFILKGLKDRQSIRFYYLVKILRYAKLSDFEILNIINEIRMNGKNTKFVKRNSAEFSRFLGYLLAEGRLAKSSQIWFTNGDREIIEDYIDLVKKLFGKNPLVREYKPHCWDVIIFSEPLKKILEKFGMSSKTEEKKISNIFLKHSSNEEIANLLNGLYSGDGYVSQKVPVVEIVTKSKELAVGIENCLLRLGISPRKKRITKSFKDFIGNYYLISSYGAENLYDFSQNIALASRKKRERILLHLDKKRNSNVDLIEANGLVKDIAGEMSVNVKTTKKEIPILDAYCYNQCTPSRNGLAVLLEKLFVVESEKTKQLKTLVESDIFWDELEEVEEIDGGEWVYDLTVEKEHNFIANNIFAHNSNISDAICFVLGRLSIKSMRAEKARNLIFMGSKYIRPAREAFVEIVFDNSDRAFAMETDEIIIKRGVRINGQSIYKINNESKTRAEIIETLGQAGIDPYGYNLILQGQIQGIVKMHPEERKKIIGEVAGISVYEWRKEKSLKELEKTESRLKEISTILRERTAFLNNLEREKTQAQKYTELQTTVKRAKASILKRKHDDKKKEIESLVRTIEEKMGLRDKNQDKAFQMQKEIENLTEKINQINKHIRDATGFEQGRLREEITNLKADLEGLKVRCEGYEHRKEEVGRRIAEMRKTIPELEQDIKKLRDESPQMAKKAGELKKKKEELSELERERKQAFALKSELHAMRERIEDRKRQLARVVAESELDVKQMEQAAAQLSFRNDKECTEAISSLTQSLSKEEDFLEELRENELAQEKRISISESEIKRNEEVKKKIEKIDVCPLCQSKMTESHVSHVITTSDGHIHSAQTNLSNAKENLSKIHTERNAAMNKINQFEAKLKMTERELLQHRAIYEKKETLKKHVSHENELKKEIAELESKRQALESKSQEVSTVSERYENKILEIEEISSRTVEDIDTTLLYKERELEKTKNIIERGTEDLEDIRGHIESLEESIEEKETLLGKKEEKEKELNARFEKMFSERDSTQKKIQETSIQLSEVTSEVRQIEDQVNYLKIGKAKLDGERETLEMDLAEHVGLELIAGSINFLEEKLRKAQTTLDEIGSINMRALEVYDSVKKEYDVVKEKVDTLEKEKEGILKIIEEIDKKKKKSFMKAFHSINTLFSENFSKLSAKGTAYLEIENQEDVFAGGVDIVVKMARGKYFDVTSLSGGEQTLVALSLLFAIQEYKPYQFYILDEIDAALDKRNSERLAALLKQYMKGGQYIVITHNDAIILDSDILYGVSMHEGVSKILSLKIGASGEKAVQNDDVQQIE